MPVIKIYSPDGGHIAAAVMGAMAVGRPEAAPGVARSKAEKTRRKNPSRLTVAQHVLPRRSLERFVGADGRVDLNDLIRKASRRAKPGDSLFCAQRAWDQRAETGYMKEIEDRFQVLADALTDGLSTIASPADRIAVCRFFALWYMRARHRDLADQEVRLGGITGDNLTKEQEETLEVKGYAFARTGGLMPARQLNGLWLQRQIDGYAEDLAKATRWGVIRPQSGKFIVTDMPLHTILPVTPTLALISETDDGIITRDNLAEINRSIIAGSQRYYLAQDLADCPR